MARSGLKVLFVLALFLTRFAAASNDVKTALTIEPPEVTISNADQTVQLLATLQQSDGSFRDVTHTAQYVLSSNKKSAASNIISIENGRIIPKADGTAVVNVVYQENGKKKQKVAATVKVTVENFSVERKLNFANDIIPIFTKAGCNTGGCHGKASGQNGFSMSLFGFDPDFDYDALVKEGRGRRLFPAAPDQSLMLLKASAQVPHGGGLKLKRDSAEYALLRRWITQGMPKGTDKDVKIERIEVLPRERFLSGGASEQQLRVVGYYTDGSSQDVTQRAEYKSQQPDILRVEPGGLVNTLDRTGEGAVMVRYMGLVDVAKITVPFSQSVPAGAYAHFKPKGFVDELALEKWKKLGIAPSSVCTDGEFIRRAYLDVTGTLPPPDEVRKFLEDKAPDKRARLIDRVLERPEYADYWANRWGDMLRNKREGEEQKRGTFAFAAWIRNSFAENKPYDKFVKEILTAQGEVGDNPPVNWYRHVRNQIHLVNDTSQLFLGTRVSCANCHHHPYEKMSQEDYWGFAAFFSRVGKKQGDVPADQAVFVQKTGETSQPRTGKKMKPKGLTGQEFEYVRGEDPRQNLVAWMTAPDNPYFSKAVVNRMWGSIMGVGLVNAIDDMRVTNPASNPKLLDALAKDFVEHKFDLKHLLRTIMNSEVYALSSEPTQYNATDRQNYARYYTKRLAAEVLLDAVCNVTGTTEKFSGLPQGTRAIELPDQAVSSYFLTTFGRSDRETACECERSYAPNLAQTLHLMNSGEIQGKIGDKNGTVSELIKANKKPEELIEDLYIRALSRKPTADELSQAVSIMADAKDKKAVLEDFAWVLLNTKEFLFNH